MENYENDSDEWEVVNTKQKKQQKQKQRKDKQKEENTMKSKEAQLEDMKKQQDKDKFMQQYNELTQGSINSGSLFGAFAAYEEKKKQKRASAEKKKTSRKIVNNGVFEGEELVFQDFEKKQKKKQAAAKQSQNQQQQSKTKKRSITEASSTIHAHDLKVLLSDYTRKYPENYDVQLKTLAEHFEVIFTDTDVEPATVQQYYKNPEQPLSYLSKDVIQTVQAWTNKMPEDALITFTWFLITTIITVTSEKKSSSASSLPPIKGIGLQMVLQILVRHQPNLIQKNVGKIKENYAHTQLLSAKSTPFFIWLFSQHISRHPSSALSLWFQFLLPLLHDSSKTEFHGPAVHFLESILANKADIHLDDASAVMGYERLVLYNAAGKPVQNKLKELVPQLLDIQFLFPSGRISKRFFTMLLGHAASDKEALRNAVLVSLVDCLAVDDACYGYWEEVYPKYIAHSSNLFLYINYNWRGKNLGEKLSADKLVTLIQSFSQINKLLKNGDKKYRKAKPNAEEVKEIDMCNVTGKTLKKTLKPYTSRKKGNLAALCTTVLPATVLIAAGVAYTITNCCDLDWCRNNAFAQEFVNCSVAL